MYFEGLIFSSISCYSIFIHILIRRRNSLLPDSKNPKSSTERNSDDKDETSAENNDKEDGTGKPEDSADQQASFVDLLV